MALSNFCYFLKIKNDEPLTSYDVIIEGSGVLSMNLSPRLEIGHGELFYELEGTEGSTGSGGVRPFGHRRLAGGHGCGGAARAMAWG